MLLELYDMYLKRAWWFKIISLYAYFSIFRRYLEISFKILLIWPKRHWRMEICCLGPDTITIPMLNESFSYEWWLNVASNLLQTSVVHRCHKSKFEDGAETRFREGHVNLTGIDLCFLNWANQSIPINIPQPKIFGKIVRKRTRLSWRGRSRRSMSWKCCTQKVADQLLAFLSCKMSPLKTKYVVYMQIVTLGKC